MCSSAPDMTAANTAAAASAQNGADALAWYKQMYADSAGDRATAATDAHAVSAAQLEQMQEQSRIASDYDQYNRTVFRPLEQGIVSDAENFDTEGKREELAGKAIADVSEAAGAARGAESRQMARLGINPNDGAYAAEATQRGNATLLAEAGAATKARSDAMTLGHAYKMDAASLGRGLPSSQVASANASINAGNSSAFNAGLPLSQAQQQAAMMGAGYGYGIQGNQVAGNIYGNVGNVQNSANASNNSTMSGLGTAVGTALMFMSDENQKEGVKPTSDEEALDAVNATPVKKWKYKAGSPADDGGQEHTGPMAQDVQKTMGSKVAPRGKMIDLISANGINMKAIQATNKKVDKLAAAMGVEV